jgi:hypothetical protein
MRLTPDQNDFTLSMTGVTTLAQKWTHFLADNLVYYVITPTSPS